MHKVTERGCLFKTDDKLESKSIVIDRPITSFYANKLLVDRSTEWSCYATRKATDVKTKTSKYRETFSDIY